MTKKKIILWWQKIPSIKKQLFFLFLFLGLVLSFYYLSCLPIITPDSLGYYNASRVIVGSFSVDQWPVLRGPTLPFALSLMTTIFGDHPVGFLLGTFILFIACVSLVATLTKKILQLVDNNLNKVLIMVLVITLVIFNPIIIGYMHSMLTEMVAIPLTLLATVIALKWIYFEPTKKNWLKSIGYLVCFSILLPITWFLKQPYFTLTAVPLVMAVGISFFRVKGWKNVVYRMVVVLVSFMAVFGLLQTWDNYICGQKICYEESKASHHLGSSLLKSATSFRLLATEEETGGDYSVYGVFNYKDEVIDKIAINKKNIAGSSRQVESLKTLAIFAKKHPIIFARSYFFNYLAITDFLPYKVFMIGTPKAHYVPVFHGFLQNGGENVHLGYQAFQEKYIVWCLLNESCPPQMDYFQNYMVFRSVPRVVRYAHKIIEGPFQFLFVMVFLFLPILFFISLYRFFKTIKQKATKPVLLNDVVLLLSGVSFLHVLSNVFTGAIIDRYISPVLALTLLATIIFVSQLFRQKQVLGKAPKQTNDKLLFVIPAYNEADSIAKVIADINKHLPEADIVVVNDNSKDDTTKLARQAGAVVLDMPFNVRYAMAVQTGIKYALANNYGYVIQFDADGQHLASEAKKMFTEMKRSQVDIVLGSRFLEKTDYPHALARVIGTKVNSSIVELLSGQKITDPTSGLQCLNRRVIEKYARMGEYPEYPDANLIVEMLLKGYQIKEVAVQMKARETGESMHSGVWKPLKYAIKVSYAIFIITLRQIEIRRNK